MIPCRVIALGIGLVVAPAYQSIASADPMFFTFDTTLTNVSDSASMVFLDEANPQLGDYVGFGARTRGSFPGPFENLFGVVAFVDPSGSLLTSTDVPNASLLHKFPGGPGQAFTISTDEPFSRPIEGTSTASSCRNVEQRLESWSISRDRLTPTWNVCDPRGERPLALREGLLAGLFRPKRY